MIHMAKTHLFLDVDKNNLYLYVARAYFMLVGVGYAKMYLVPVSVCGLGRLDDVGYVSVYLVPASLLAVTTGWAPLLDWVSYNTFIFI